MSSINEVPTQLIKQNAQGFIFDKNKITSAKKKAFVIDNNSNVKQCSISASYNFTNTTKFKNDLHLFSVFLNISSKDARQRFESFFNEPFQNSGKAIEITLDSCIRISDEFLHSVNNALDENTDENTDINASKIEKLHQITSDYGSFYPCKLVFDYRNGQWKKTASDDFHIIFDLLKFYNNDLWERILDILGYQILDAGVKLLEFIPLLPTPFQIEELTAIKNISKCQIYASILNEDQSIRNAFSLHINFVDNNTPEIYIHPVHSLHQKFRDELNRFFGSSMEKIKIKIYWMVVGRPLDVDFEITQSKYPVILRSYDSENFTTRTNIIQISVEDNISKLYRNTKSRKCILTSHVLKPPQDDDIFKPIIVGTHFSPPDKLCLFVKGNSIDSGILERLKLHYW